MRLKKSHQTQTHPPPPHLNVSSVSSRHVPNLLTAWGPSGSIKFCLSPCLNMNFKLFNCKIKHYYIYIDPNPILHPSKVRDNSTPVGNMTIFFYLYFGWRNFLVWAAYTGWVKASALAFHTNSFASHLKMRSTCYCSTFKEICISFRD